MEDTICAIATAVGGAVAVIRLSGDNACGIVSGLWHGKDGKTVSELSPRHLSLGTFSGVNGVLDPSCLAVRMPRPNSYTGEDVVEFHCHGGAVCARALLREILRAGAQLAEPGEFSKRAFLNGKMDLTQAEAVSDMISAGSEAALKLAGRQLLGAIGRRVAKAEDALQDLLAEIESRLDFPEEELDWRPQEEVCGLIEAASSDMQALADTRDEGEIMRGGVSLVIAGPPNVGKSSMLNLILGRDRAIVSDVPGTTRDTIEASVQLRGIPFKLVDTAGVRGGETDVIERAGIARSRESVSAADLVLWVVDASKPYSAQAWPGWEIRGKLLLVANKCDLPHDNDSAEGAIFISALNNIGMDGLYASMEDAVLAGVAHQGDVAVAARHAALFSQAAESLGRAIPLVANGEWELAAIELRDAIGCLGRVTGKTVEPDVLDTIFSRFCIGK